MKITRPTREQSEAAWKALQAPQDLTADLLTAYLTTPERIPTGIGPLDRSLQGGIKQGALTVIAGTPGAGKTALAVQIAANAAKSRPVLFVSGELDRKAVWFRIASLTSLTTGEPVAYGETERAAAILRKRVAREFSGATVATEADYERVAALDPMAQALTLAARRYGAHLAIKDDLVTMADACTLAANLSALEPQPLLIVDYLQMFSRDEATKSQYEAITAASHALIDLVRQTGLGAVVLSSMNREGTRAGKDKAPDLESLRGSGQIGFDADTVLILAADKERAQPHLGARGVIAHIVKQRTGAQDQIPLDFWSAHGAFIDPMADPASLRVE